MSSNVSASGGGFLQSLRDMGVGRDARTVGRAVTRIPMKTHAARVDFGWDMLRWTLHVTSALLVMAAVINLLAGGFIQTVGWLTLAALANRAAVNSFLVRQWFLFGPQRRANIAAARTRVRHNRVAVRQSRRTLPTR